MNKIIITIISLFFLSNSGFAQIKEGEPEFRRKNNNTNNLILGIFNPNNFTMNHSLNFSMVNSRYGNIGITSYTNSMNYKFNDKLNIQADITMQYSPFTKTSFGSAFDNQLQNDLNGLTLSRVKLNYKVSDNAFINVEFRNGNNGLYDDRYYDPYYWR
ncbi:MAG TPA: hypothetical protein PLG90_02040 [Ignavibacteria bacterium]|nr:hypothetical protein [Ignavibacteria bacterium]